MRLNRNKQGSGVLTVIIPVLNESATIQSVVRFAAENPLVSEVLVVDDGSIDGTPELASEAGARVITSTMLGKGASMEDGMRAAKTELLLYIDGDLRGLAPDCIERLAAPLLSDEADFVKASFTREAGRVTVLTARPLIKTYFPELAHFDQPLSGIIAARKSLLETFLFENDYGVDIALLIDAVIARARVKEVNIGHIEHQSQSLEALGEMATQVARALLDRASRAGRFRTSFVQKVRENERLARATSSMHRVPAAEKIALFDMRVLLNCRLTVELAKVIGCEEGLWRYLDNNQLSDETRTRNIAQLFSGTAKETFIQVARNIPLRPDAVHVIVTLRKMGYKVGIVSDSFHLVAEIIRRRVFADFIFSHLMKFSRNKATGKLTIGPTFRHAEGCDGHSYCKSNVLQHLQEKLAIDMEQVVAVGHGQNDNCFLRLCGQSFAFRPQHPSVSEISRYTITELSQMLDYLSPVNPCRNPGQWIDEEILFGGDGEEPAPFISN
ncbi:MAG: glycosyltransferase [Verrucomicrobiota bacterium]|nr:glycosyltransferase [Verrucomicrobiota bacterium]